MINVVPLQRWLGASASARASRKLSATSEIAKKPLPIILVMFASMGNPRLRVILRWPESVVAWATEKKLDAAIWTALSSNFAQRAKRSFSEDAAIGYLRTLSAAGKAKAAEYVWRAPAFVQTPVRSALQRDPWFSRAVTPIPSLTGDEAFRVVELIRPSFDKYVAMCNERKFPSTAYDQLVGAFGIPQQVTDCDLRNAILWKFGHLIKQEPSIPRSHEVLITVLQREWAMLSSNLADSAWQAFQHLRDAIGGKRRYVTVSFLLHLLRPTEIPIIDQHNFRAMNHYLTMVRDGWKSKAKPSTFGDLVVLSGFMSSVLCYWRSIDPTRVPSERALDRFLMMFGKALKRRKPLAPGRGPSDRETLVGCADPTGNRSIRLPFGEATATFEVVKLIEYVNESGRDYIIQGQNQCPLAAHPKPKSLDYWLRVNCTKNHDTTQAVNEVIGQLVSTGLFEEGRFRCPDSGRTCKGIRLAAGADAR
jgi:hypothetical protein